MDALLFALVLEVSLLQLKILEGTTALRRKRKPVSKTEKAQLDKLSRDRTLVKDVLRRTLIEAAERGEWLSLLQAVRGLEQRISLPVTLRTSHERIKASLQESTADLIQKRNQWAQELRNSDKKIAFLRDKMRDDLQNAKARLCYTEKWLLARAESQEMLFQRNRPPLPRPDHEQRVHDELIKAYQFQIKEREASYEYWQERYMKDTADINQRLMVKCEQLRVAIARREDLQKLDSEGRAHSMQHGATGEAARTEQGGDVDSGLDYDLHAGEMRSWLTFKRERAARLAREQRINNAAKSIQAWWRGTMVRCALGQFRSLRSAKKSAKGKKK